MINTIGCASYNEKERKKLGGMVDNERANLYIMETIKDMFNKMQDEDLSGDIMRICMEPLPHDDYIKVEVEF